MPGFIDFTGPNRSLELFGIRLVGINADTGKKVLLSLVFVLLIVLLRKMTGYCVGRMTAKWTNRWKVFWVRQSVMLSTSLMLLVGLVSIWFDDPARLATALGLVTAGLAFALQRVVTAIAGYFIILRNNVFHIGDRIVMGGVRGDVMKLGFTQTTIMEMGQPPSVQAADPAMWVRGRQYTGRLVTVSNAMIFEEPIFNYTREFPYVWEEINIPVEYRADRRRVESILLEVASRHTVTTAALSEPVLREFQQRYFLKPFEIGPRVYYRITDNWLEISVRFIVEGWGIREIKDAMTRDILEKLDEAGIGIASQTIDLVNFPLLRVKHEKIKDYLWLKLEYYGRMYGTVSGFCLHCWRCLP
jgi:small-conductance mechanosensitive channel